MRKKRAEVKRRLLYLGIIFVAILLLTSFVSDFILGKTAVFLTLKESIKELIFNTWKSLVGERVLFAPPCSSGYADNVSQYNITWFFDGCYRVGQFVNGDWWVVGPLTIINITPLFNGTIHGWQVNPTSVVQHGLDKRAWPGTNFNASLVPSLPYFANPTPILSIVKGLSNETATRCPNTLLFRSCPLLTAAVLTVVNSIPSDNGLTVFRPGYFGNSSSKSYYSTSSINLNVLPRYAAVNAPSQSSIESHFQRAQIDFIRGVAGSELHPAYNMPNYGSEIAQQNTEAALYFMTNASSQIITLAHIYYLQAGIDLFNILNNGGSWPGDGGHGNGRVVPIVFAAHVLENQAMKNTIKNVNSSARIFSEYEQLSRTANGDAIWGQPATIFQYWENIVKANQGSTARDSYNYIDGGLRPGESYQNLNIGNIKYIALVFNLMPSLQLTWNASNIIDYAYRWVTFGAWTQPDLCAPADGVCVKGTNVGGYCNSAGENQSNPFGSCGSLVGCNIYCPGGGYCNYTVNWATNYGKTYGHNSTSNTCILDTNLSDGIGRYPLRHGLGNNTGQYKTALGEEMWNKYFNLSLQSSGGSCIDGQTRNCPLQQGVCAGSQEICSEGIWPGCFSTSYGTDYEIIETNCNDGKDNDCDGLIDNNDNNCVIVDTVPPVISSIVNNSITNQSAIVSWQTDEGAISRIYYGTTINLENNILDLDYLVAHSMQLLSLLANTTYFYKVGSCDVSGNCANSSLFNFRTTAGAFVDNEGPIINLGNPANGNDLNSNSLIFSYTPIDFSSVSSCTLYIGVETRVDDAIENSIENNFSVNLANGYYYWSISCIDSFGNRGESETRTLNINYQAPVYTGSSGGGGYSSGGGGGGYIAPQPKVDKINESLISNKGIDKISLQEEEVGFIDIGLLDSVVLDLYSILYEIRFEVSEAGVLLKVPNGDYLIPKDDILPVLLGWQEMYVGVKRADDNGAGIILGLNRELVKEQLGESSVEQRTGTAYIVIGIIIFVIGIVLLVGYVLYRRDKTKQIESAKWVAGSKN